MSPHRRLAAVMMGLGTMAVVALGIELAARVLQLDLAQLERVAVAEGAPFGGSRLDAFAPAWRERAAPLLEGYLPTGFTIDEGGFTSHAGRCRFDHPGPTVLAMGDSTTVMTADPSSHQPPMGAGDPSQTWPALLAAELGTAVQVCTIAELGFHPQDHARFLEVLAPTLQPDLVVVLLCSNDLEPLAPRVRHPDGEGSIYYGSNGAQQAHGALPLPWLFAHSEAWRHLQWRATQRWPEGAIELPSPRFPAEPAELSLRELTEAAPRVELFYLPKLRDGGPSVDLGALGVPIRALELPAPRERLRYSPQDPVHMNADGHRAVVEGMVPVVRERMGLVAAAGQ
jgi:lysophospholipase L1-like esterase